MLNKVIVSAVSLILVVGVVIGVVAFQNGRGKGGAESVETKDNASPQMRAVNQLCQPTNFQDVCIQTLAATNSTDPKELIEAGILAISDSLTKTLNLSNDLVGNATNEPRAKMALEDCQDLLQQAKDELQATFSQVGDSDIHTLVARADDFRTWLSSIIAYNEMCLEGFGEESNPIKQVMQNSTDWVEQLTDNSLVIIRELSEVLKSLGLQINVPSRRLLQDNGYPTWMSAADRKLLASKTKRGAKKAKKVAKKGAKAAAGVAAGAAAAGAAAGAADPNVGPGSAPNAVVAQDGSGQFKTIMAAVNAMPNTYSGRYVIYVKAGVYREQVTIPKDKINVLMYGDGPAKTIITGDMNFAKQGINTWNTATVVVLGDGFIAKDLQMQNTAGWEGHQAVALRCNSDMSAFYNVKLDGYQDTLCYQAKRQFYRNCVITGTIDFLFGFGSIVIQNSVLVVRKPGPTQFNTVTADGKKTPGMKSGLVIQNCQIIAEDALIPDRFTVKSYLGRPWKKYATTVVMESEISDVIDPSGWTPWSGADFEKTLYYAEYGNTGASAATNNRIKWGTLRFINSNEAQQYTVGPFIQGSAWIAGTGVPAFLGFKA